MSSDLPFLPVDGTGTNDLEDLLHARSSGEGPTWIGPYPNLPPRAFALKDREQHGLRNVSDVSERSDDSFHTATSSGGQSRMPSSQFSPQVEDAAPRFSPRSSGRDDSNSTARHWRNVRHSLESNNLHFPSLVGVSAPIPASPTGRPLTPTRPVSYFWEQGLVRSGLNTDDVGGQRVRSASQMERPMSEMLVDRPPDVRSDNVKIYVDANPTVVSNMSDPTNPEEWTLDRVLLWLEQNGFGDEWQESFKANQVEKARFLGLTSYLRVRKVVPSNIQGSEAPAKLCNAIRKMLDRNSLSNRASHRDSMHSESFPESSVVSDLAPFRTSPPEPELCIRESEADLKVSDLNPPSSHSLSENEVDMSIGVLPDNFDEVKPKCSGIASNIPQATEGFELHNVGCKQNLSSPNLLLVPDQYNTVQLDRRTAGHRQSRSEGSNPARTSTLQPVSEDGSSDTMLDSTSQSSIQQQMNSKYNKTTIGPQQSNDKNVFGWSKLFSSRDHKAHSPGKHLNSSKPSILSPREFSSTYARLKPKSCITNIETKCLVQVTKDNELYALVDVTMMKTAQQCKIKLSEKVGLLASRCLFFATAIGGAFHEMPLSDEELLEGCCVVARPGSIKIFVQEVKELEVTPALRALNPFYGSPQGSDAAMQRTPHEMYATETDYFKLKTGEIIQDEMEDIHESTAPTAKAPSLSDTPSIVSVNSRRLKDSRNVSIEEGRRMSVHSARSGSFEFVSGFQFQSKDTQESRRRSQIVQSPRFEHSTAEVLNMDEADSNDHTLPGTHQGRPVNFDHPRASPYTQNMKANSRIPSIHKDKDSQSKQLGRKDSANSLKAHRMAPKAPHGVPRERLERTYSDAQRAAESRAALSGTASVDESNSLAASSKTVGSLLRKKPSFFSRARSDGNSSKGISALVNVAANHAAAQIVSGKDFTGPSLARGASTNRPGTAALRPDISSEPANDTIVLKAEPLNSLQNLKPLAIYEPEHEQLCDKVDDLSNLEIPQDVAEPIKRNQGEIPAAFATNSMSMLDLSMKTGSSHEINRRVQISQERYIEPVMDFDDAPAFEDSGDDSEEDSGFFVRPKPIGLESSFSQVPREDMLRPSALSHLEHMNVGKAMRYQSMKASRSTPKLTVVTETLNDLERPASPEYVKGDDKEGINSPDVISSPYTYRSPMAPPSPNTSWRRDSTPPTPLNDGVDRRKSFARHESWAFRPPAEVLVNQLEDYFPDHDIDNPIIEEGPDDPSPASSTNVSTTHLTTGPKLADRRSRMKSIRFVASQAVHKPIEAKKKWETAISRVQLTNLLRRRPTTVWGMNAVEVATGKGLPPVSDEVDQKDAMMKRAPTFKWIRGELIGRGTYGRVYLAMNALTGEMLAVKEVETFHQPLDGSSSSTKTVVEVLNEEINTMKGLDHEHIVEYLGYERTDTRLSIFLEYVSGGSVGSCLKRHGKFEETVIRSLTRQTLSGLCYLHEKGILHRDLKADNLLLDVNGTCKISDFGISKRSRDVYDNDANMSMQGTIFWMAPEVIQTKKEGYSAKIDIWSLGCVVLEMFAGRRPWSNAEAISVLFAMGSKGTAPPIPEDVAPHISSLALDFLNKCFVIDPSDRPTAQELLLHPFCVIPEDFKFKTTKLGRLVDSAK